MKEWMILLASSVLVRPAGAAEMDKQRLWELTEMADFKVVTGAGSSTTKGIIYHDEKTDPPQTGIARIRKEDFFAQVLKPDDQNKSAKKAHFAPGERMGPDQEREAIALIKRRGGTIRRRDNRSDSPVVEVIFLDDKFTDEDLFVLTAFPQLRNLSLNCDAITGEALDYLEPLPQLRTLELVSEKITDAGLVCLKRFPNLRRLLLMNKVSDEGMVHLQGLTQLRSLDLHGPRLCLAIPSTHRIGGPSPPYKEVP